MNGSHQAFDNAKLIIQDFGHGGQTIGGARSITHNQLLRGILMMVDTIDKGGSVIFGRSWENDPFGPGYDMRLRFFFS